MRPLTVPEVHESFANAAPDDLRRLGLPHDFVLLDWDHLDFLAWRDPQARGRGYLLAERAGRPVGIVLRAAEGVSRARSAMCNLCHTMQPGDQVTLFTAPRPGKDAGSIGTYLCADLSCHENVRLALPLAPSEVRASVDRRIDGTRHRAEAFIDSVLTDGAVRAGDVLEEAS
jgi:hypothetical protein